MTFWNELRRRNVFRVGIAYAALAWVLLQIFDVVGDIFELPAWGGKLILAMLLVGFVLALVFAWAFEMTPEGLKRDKDVDRSRSVAAQTGRKLDRVIIGVLALAVVYLLVDKLLLQDLIEAPDTAPAAAAAPPDESPSVAVLPFVNMSGDADNEYFSDGLTETLLHMLAQLPGLKVAARTSSFAFKGQSAGIGEIAATLGVAHVLEGSVQKADDRVRVTAQLIRADDGFHVWSQNYTRPLEDIFAIQDEIAGDVARALGSSLLGAEAPALHGVSTTDVDAYDSYLKGLEQQAIYSYGSLELAEGHFKQALARDPDFTDARLALARNYMDKFSTGLVDREAVQARALPLIRQAREQEPQNAQAEAYELVLQLVTAGPALSDLEIRSRVDQLLMLLAEMPEETFIRIEVANTLGYFFNETGRAIDVLQAGLLVDPLQAELHRSLGELYVRDRRLDEARAAFQRALELSPESPNVYGSMARLELAADRLAAALDWARRASEVDPQDHEIAFQIAWRLYRLRLPEEAEPWLARVQALAPGSSLARLLQVEEALARDETGRAIELAAAMIADQVDLRHGAFDIALVNYIDAMQREGRSREGYDFLVGVRPEIEDFGRIPEDLQGLFMQWAAIDLMSGFETFENRKAAWERFDAALDATGTPLKYDPASEYHTWNHLMRGDVEAAVAHYLEYEQADPLAQDLERHRRPLALTLAPVYEDPRVTARLAADAERFDELRDDVIAMLQRPEWSTQ